MFEELTGREAFILAKALFVAANSLKAMAHPPWSDIEDMESLLNSYFPNFANTLQLLKDQHGQTSDAEILVLLEGSGPNHDVLALFEAHTRTQE